MSNLVLMAVYAAGLSAGVATLRVLERRGASPASQAGFAIFATIVMGAFLLAISEPQPIFSDFYKAYYGAAHAVWTGEASRPAFYARGVEGFVAVPVLAWAFVPFVWLGAPLAGYAFLALGIVVAVVMWRGLVRVGGLARPQAWLLLFLMGANGPLLYNLREGNTSHVTLLMLVAALLMMQRGRDLLAGLLVGFAAVLKLPMLLFGALFVVRGRWRAVAGGALALAATAVVSAASFGWEMNVEWYRSCVAPYTRNPIPGFNNQSIHAFFARLELGPQSLHVWDSVEAGPRLRIATALALGVLFAAAIGSALRPVLTSTRAEREVARETLFELEFALTLVVALVASTISWAHYYLWLLLPAAFLLGSRGHLPCDTLTRATGWAAVVLASLPVVYVPLHAPISSQLYARLAVSHALAGGLLMLAALARARWHVRPAAVRG